MYKRILKLPLIGLVAFAAGCGGQESGPQTSRADGTAIENTTVETTGMTPAESTAAVPDPAAAGQVHTVKMVTTQNGASGVFEPAQLNVKKGDTVRFVADGAAPHNVNFQTPDNAGKPGLPGPSPYLTAAGQTYDLKVDMDPGSYKYQCDPHAAMGMVAALTVSE